jgi:cupin fold WbuC family metalloprotein
MVIDKAFLDRLTEEAKASPRKRMHYDLRDDENDLSMRMLNAMEPETVIPIHRHNETTEEIVVLRGEVEEILYDDQGNEVERYHLKAGGDAMACRVPIGQYHTCRSLKSGTVIIEFKRGMYDPATTEDFLKSVKG